MNQTRSDGLMPKRIWTFRDKMENRQKKKVNSGARPSGQNGNVKRKPSQGQGNQAKRKPSQGHTGQAKRSPSEGQNSQIKRRPVSNGADQAARRRALKEQQRRRETARKKLLLVIAAIIVVAVVVIVLSVSGGKKSETVSDGSNANAVNAETEEAVETSSEEVTETTSAESANTSEYTSLGVNEMGEIPVMMYHGIENVSSDSTGYTGGNVDVDGYNRTAEAFRADLEMYYKKGYRMIRLTDYVDGNIDVEKGMSPICITFDDGRENQCKVTGVDADGNIEIDPNCAVGILEEFKAKHPDAPVTATFFVNGSLFQQPEYNAQILNWLVDNGYDVGNHTWDHINLSTCSTDEVPYQVGADYEQLESIIPGKYVNIVALPFGSGAEEGSETRPLIYNTSYNGIEYTTKACMMVGWTSEFSPFSSSFDALLMKRCRAYDNNGQEFDISYMFDSYLPTARYVSDGDPDTIVIPAAQEANIGETYGKTVVTY